MSITESIPKISGFALLEQLRFRKKKLVSEKIVMDKKDNHIYPIVDIPFEIPENWVWCYLSDISIIQEGPGIRKHQYCEEGIQFLTVTNILEGAVDLEKSKKYISTDEYQSTYKHFTINYGDIVTACSGGSWGKSAIFEANKKLILNTSTLRLRFFNDLGSNQFLYYLTKTSFFKNSLDSHLTGQQPNYGYSHYSKIKIPLPPLIEQQAIVAILDEAFAGIAQAKANAEQNLKNAKELFESYLQSIQADKKPLGSLVDIKTGKLNSNAAIDGGMYPFFTCSREIFAIDNYAFDLEAILLAGNNASGDFNVKHYKGKFNAYQRTYVITVSKDNELLYRYLYFQLLNSLKEFKEKSVGANTRFLKLGMIQDMKIPLPPLKEQQIIVQKLDALSAETKQLEAIYQQKIKDLDELKKSILQKAFAGELNTSALELEV
jgi:type I restriction enzyme S subunit